MIEVIVIAGGAVLGWLAVWYGMSALRIGPASTVDTEADPGKSWPELLGVSARASEEVVRAAYQRKLAELSAVAPRLMTATERAAHEASREQLEAAYRCGMRASRER